MIKSFFFRSSALLGCGGSLRNFQLPQPQLLGCVFVSFEFCNVPLSISNLQPCVAQPDLSLLKHPRALLDRVVAFLVRLLYQLLLSQRMHDELVVHDFSTRRGSRAVS